MAAGSALVTACRQVEARRRTRSTIALRAARRKEERPGATDLGVVRMRGQRQHVDRVRSRGEVLRRRYQAAPLARNPSGMEAAAAASARSMTSFRTMP